MVKEAKAKSVKAIEVARAKAAAKDTIPNLLSQELKVDIKQDYINLNKLALDNLDKELLDFADKAIKDN